ncbi:MAG: trypsin-like peptidase domain-containing protein [Verrucomicrobiota bacterium]
MPKTTITLLLLCGLATASPASTSRRTAVVEAVEKTLPSVVNLGTERLVKVRYTDPLRRFRGDLFDQFFSDFFAQPMAPGYRVAHSLGSGVIIDPHGYILTNHHVIERASKIRVTLCDESTYDAVLLAGDEMNDLALIKINPAKPLKAVEFAKDDDVMLGETVIALGNPFGLAQTVTVGVLSSKNREAKYEGQVLFRDILQTDAAVNPGSSGGPLLNIDGQLIGVNVAIYREAQNIGFAVPVARVRALLARWLAPKVLAKMVPGFEAEYTNGAVRISQVHEKLLPAGAELRLGDVVKAVGGQPVGDLYEMDRALLMYKAGDKLTVDIERGDQPVRADVVMAPLPKPDGKALAQHLLGLDFAERPTSEGAVRLGINKGLPIAEVIGAGVAAKAGLRPGLLVTRINDYEISSLDDVGQALENVRAGDAVLLGLLSVEETGSFLVAQSSSVQLKVEE